MAKVSRKAVDWLKKYLRYTDYLGTAQLYLKENFLLDESLEKEHFKCRILGHWGTVPGINFIYGSLNYIISKHKAEMLLVTGPGHGAPANLANLFVEGTLKEYYPQYSRDYRGMGKIIKDFSWPYSYFPSHVTPSVPGSILEGGELGYSLSTAFGSVFDNPNLIAATIVGDGEAESAPLAGSWFSNKFLNPKTSGAVLPIVLINGYKISNPTIYGTMSDKELKEHFKGWGYEPFIVSGTNIEEKMLNTLEDVYKKIRLIQKKARTSKTTPLKPCWPVILLRTPKGWKGIKKYRGKLIEGTFHSHGIPVGHPKEQPEALSAVEKWLKSYKIKELVDKKGKPKKEVLKFVPKGKYRMGMNKHTIGGNIYKPLKLPNLSKYEVKFKRRGGVYTGPMGKGGEFLRDVLTLNKRQKNFMIFCPDEAKSNKLDAVFEVTKRQYLWPITEKDEDIATEGRVVEILSEQTLQGWYQGYLLTGRHGILVSYEAFAMVLASMVDQHAKFLKQSFKVKWRKPIASTIYVLSSLGWRQDHNGYSHQNPSFVSNILQKHGKFCQIYYPPDVNSLIAAYEEVLNKKDSIAVIVAGKRDLPVWLTMKEAREQARGGIGIWEWVGGKEGTKNPDVVLASAGDYLTREAIYAVKLCKKLIPELKIRYVNISELTSMGLGDFCPSGKSCLTQVGFDKHFTKDRKIVFNYHGYTNDLKQILWSNACADRFILHGYKEKGSTTTPFDMKVLNGVSSYNLVIDLVKEGAKFNKKVKAKKIKVLRYIKEQLENHKEHIVKYGDDLEEVKNLKW